MRVQPLGSGMVKRNTHHTMHEGSDMNHLSLTLIRSYKPSKFERKNDQRTVRVRFDPYQSLFRVICIVSLEIGLIWLLRVI